MIIIVQDLHTGGGERVMSNYLSTVKEKHLLYCSEECRSPYVKSIKVTHWETVPLFFKAFDILFRANKTQPIIVVLTKPIIVFGILNIIFKKNLYLYEHCDPYLLYFNRPGLISHLKSAALRLSIKNNKMIVVTELIRRKLVDDLQLDPIRIQVLNNPCVPIKSKLMNISTTYCNLDNVYLIIGRDSPEKRINQAISFYNNEIKSATTTLWLVTHTDRDIQGPDAIFKDFQSLNDYVLAKQIFYRPTLLNFSVSESFSLIIAEFLSSNLRVISAYSDTLAQIWAQFKGFHFIPLAERTEEQRQNYKPVSYTQYIENLREIIQETTNE